MNNRETHEQEIEVELLNPDELEAQEDEIELSALALDGDLIEALYQEQMQEQQEETASGRAEVENTPDGEKAAADRAESADQTGGKTVERPGTDGENPNRTEEEETTASCSEEDGKTAERPEKSGTPLTNGAEVSENADVAGGDAADKIVLPDEDGAGEFELPEKIILDDAEAVDLEDAIINSMAAAGETVSAEQEEADAEEPQKADAQESGDTDAVEEEANKPKKKKSVVRRILKGVLITFEVLILALIVYVVAIVVQADSTTDLISRLSQSLLGKAVLSAMIQEDYEDNVQETIDSEQISTNEGLDVTPYTLEGDYTSFVIFGVDARGDEFDSGTNSDTIIIVTIQNETGRVRMASIYRDTYLQIESNNGGVHYAKANSAYSSGGAVRALNMLNTNFDLALEDYVVVNFTGVADIIDELGGLDITLSEGEVEQLNYHLAGSMYATGLTASKISSAGLNHLNGVQALTYARIRKTTFTDPETGEEYNNDYGRTRRQQYVISLLAAKAKQATVSELTAIVNRVFSYNTDEEKVIGTTYAFDDIISMIPLALNFTLDGGEGYPDNKTTMIMSDLNGADCVIATDLVADVSALHEYLYDEENYSPTATVRNIADTITERAATYGTSD